MPGLGRYGRDNQEAVRRSFSAPTITQNDPAKIVFFDREVYGLKQRVFDCERILAQVTQEQCAASYRRDAIGSSCRGCAIGRHFNGDAPIEEDRHSAINNSLGLSCIRCEKSSRTNARLIGRMRLIGKTKCPSCFNRQREIEKFRAGLGGNSKGGVPKKWAHLQEATITIKDATGKRKTLDIGLCQDYLECARYVERLHPDATLIETAIGGEVISQFSLWTPLPFSLWEPSMARDEKPSKPKRAYTHRSTPRTSSKTSTVAPPVDWDDWDTPLYAKPAQDDHRDTDGSGNVRRHGWLPPMSKEEDAAYRASFEEGGTPDPESIALPEVAEPAVSESEQPEHKSEWAGCYVVRDGVTTYATDYAREHGISDEAAAIELGLCDPEYAEEPEAAAAPEPQPAPEPVKAEPSPIPKKLTGKQLRKLEKAQRRAGRMAAAPAPPEMPTLGKSPRAIAITARAVVQVAFELNGIR